MPQESAPGLSWTSESPCQRDRSGGWPAGCARPAASGRGGARGHLPEQGPPCSRQRGAGAFGRCASFCCPHPSPPDALRGIPWVRFRTSGGGRAAGGQARRRSMHKNCASPSLVPTLRAHEAPQLEAARHGVLNRRATRRRGDSNAGACSERWTAARSGTRRHRPADEFCLSLRGSSANPGPLIGWQQQLRASPPSCTQAGGEGGTGTLGFLGSNRIVQGRV